MDASHQGNGSVSSGPLMLVVRLQMLMALSHLPRGDAVYHSMEAFVPRESYIFSLKQQEFINSCDCSRMAGVSHIIVLLGISEECDRDPCGLEDCSVPLR